MRRTDREIASLGNILSILDRCEVMRLGLSVDHKPYIVPMNFAYDIIDDTVYIYFHCAPEGRKMDMIAQNSNVCFEADSLRRITKGNIACGWSVEYESVIGEGEIAVITDEAIKRHALNKLMEKYGYGGTPRYNPQVISAVTILRVLVTAITGKRK